MYTAVCTVILSMSISLLVRLYADNVTAESKRFYHFFKVSVLVEGTECIVLYNRVVSLFELNRVSSYYLKLNILVVCHVDEVCVITTKLTTCWGGSITCYKNARS